MKFTREPLSHSYDGSSWCILEEDGPVFYPGVSGHVNPKFVKDEVEWKRLQDEFEELHREKRTYSYQGEVTLANEEQKSYWVTVVLRDRTGRITYPETMTDLDEARRWMKSVIERLKQGYDDYYGRASYQLREQGYNYVYSSCSKEQPKSREKVSDDGGKEGQDQPVKPDWILLNNWFSGKPYDGCLYVRNYEKMQIEMRGPWDELIEIFPVARSQKIYTDYTEKQEIYWELTFQKGQNLKEVVRMFFTGFTGLQEELAPFELLTWTEEKRSGGILVTFTVKGSPYLWRLDYRYPAHVLNKRSKEEPYLALFSVAGEIAKHFSDDWYYLKEEENTVALQKERKIYRV